MSDATSGKRSSNSEAKHSTCGSSNSSSYSRTASRHGHPSRLRNVSAAVETGSGRCDAAAAYQPDQQSPNHIDSATSFREIGKAAMKRESSELHVGPAGCKHGASTSFDNNVIAFDCPHEEFRSIEASLYQFLHRTTSSEPLRIVHRTRGQKGFEAWQANSAKVRSEEYVRQKCSVCSTDQQHLREGQAKDVEQFDILRTFANEMNNFENRFGKIKDEEKMLAVKKLMPESLLTYRFRRTTMSYSELTHCCAGEHQ